MEQIGQIISSFSQAAARCQICIKPSYWSIDLYQALWLANLTTRPSHQESINNAESPRNPEMWVKLDVRKTTTDNLIPFYRETKQMLDLLKLSFVINNSGLQSGQIQVKLELNLLSKQNILFKTLPRGVHNIWRSTVLSLSAGPLLGRTLHRCIISL